MMDTAETNEIKLRREARIRLKEMDASLKVATVNTKKLAQIIREQTGIDSTADLETLQRFVAGDWGKPKPKPQPFIGKPATGPQFEPKARPEMRHSLAMRAAIERCQDQPRLTPMTSNAQPTWRDSL